MSCYCIFKRQSSNSNHHLPTQVGVAGVHIPSGPHVSMSVPDISYPVPQLYVATLVKVVPEGVSTWPLSGFDRGPQSTAAWVCN